MSFVVLPEDMVPGVTPGLVTHEKVTHKLHNARGKVYFTADTSLANGGAKGDGVTDDTVAINDAITKANADGRGEVVLTGQTGSNFKISLQAGSPTGCIHMRTNVTLTGFRKAKLTLASGQVDFTRPITTYAAAFGFEIRNLEIDGNQANQPQGNNVGEHQAGIFLDSALDFRVANVIVHDMRGDGIHVSTSSTANCIRGVIENFQIFSCVRVGLNLNRWEQGIATKGNIYDCSNMVKCEIDSELSSISNPYYALDDVVLTQIIVKGNVNQDGFVLSGSSSTTRLRNMVISNCEAHTVGNAYLLGAYGCDSFTLSHNTAESCQAGILTTSYHATIGGDNFEAHTDFVIVGNTVRNGTSTSNAQIDLANVRRATICSNVVVSAVATRGIRLQHGKDSIISDNVVRLELAGTTTTGIQSFRGGDVEICSNLVRCGGTAITISDGTRNVVSSTTAGSYIIDGPASGQTFVASDTNERTFSVNCTAGSTTVDGPTGAGSLEFLATDVGATVILFGAGAAGVDLITSIVSVNTSTGDAVVAAAPSTNTTASDASIPNGKNLFLPGAGVAGADLTTTMIHYDTGTKDVWVLVAPSTNTSGINAVAYDYASWHHWVDGNSVAGPDNTQANIGFSISGFVLYEHNAYLGTNVLNAVTQTSGTTDQRAGFPFLSRHTFGGKKKTFGTAAPSTGTWTVGDRCENTNPSETGTASSKYIIDGWVCTVAGTPGTWLQRRVLTGN